jgi:hypothetical protein
MTNRRTALVWSATAAAFCFATLPFVARAADPAAPPRLTAEQIVERNVAARGGLEAWRAVKAISMTGQLDAGGKQDVKLPFTMTMKRPHSSRLELHFQDQTALQVYDGIQGWKVRPFLKRTAVVPYPPAATRAAADADQLDGMLIDHVAKGTKVAVAGMDTVEGKSAYRLDLASKDGVARHLWVDATSFLEVKVDGEPRRLDGKMHAVAVYYRDYRREAGLMVPHTLETAVEGVKATHRMTIESVKINPAIDGTAFLKPQRTVARSAS